MSNHQNQNDSRNKNVPVVPKRNDIDLNADGNLDLSSGADKIESGADPRFVYEYASTRDVSDPGHYSNKLQRKRMPNGEIREPWVFANMDDDPELQLGRARQDQGDPTLDTARRNGSLVLMKTLKHNAECEDRSVAWESEQRRKSRSKESAQYGGMTLKQGISNNIKASAANVAFGNER